MRLIFPRCLCPCIRCMFAAAVVIIIIITVCPCAMH
jgi:hypothetical protein